MLQIPTMKNCVVQSSSKKAKLICINDSIQLKEFEKVKQSIVESFEKVLPVKSKYEL